MAQTGLSLIKDTTNHRVWCAPRRHSCEQRAERLWLAIAIATWWVLSVGGEAEDHLPAAIFPAMPDSHRQQSQRWRWVGIFRQSWSLIMTALFNYQPLPLGRSCPEPWPAVPIAPSKADHDNRLLGERIGEWLFWPSLTLVNEWRL